MKPFGFLLYGRCYTYTVEGDQLQDPGTKSAALGQRHCDLPRGHRASAPAHFSTVFFVYYLESPFSPFLAQLCILHSLDMGIHAFDSRIPQVKAETV